MSDGDSLDLILGIKLFVLLLLCILQIGQFSKQKREMMLRSSSTPVLGSLLSSIAESPNNNNHVETNTPNRHPLPSTVHHNHKKLSYHQTGSVHLSSASCNSSPISPSVTESFSLNGHSYNGFRRAQSEGNLEALAYASCNSDDDYYNSKQPHKLSGRLKSSMLETIPSFSFYNSRGRYQDEEEESDAEEEEEEGEEFEKNDDLLERFVEGQEKFLAIGGGEFSWEKNKNTGSVKEKEFMTDFCNVSYGRERDMISSEMYLAKGLGVNVDDIGGFGYGGGGRGCDFNQRDSGNGGSDDNNPKMEEYYKRMVEENPGNPLFLRNYAQFLYQSKKDLQGAEDYYSRAILADPKDGEILSQYAKLTWELHRDEDRALSYFERAVQAAPEDSHVHAAYASFIWEIEEAEDEDNEIETLDILPPHFHGTMASATA